MGSDTTPGPRSRRDSSCAFLQFEEMFKFKAHTVHILATCDALTTSGIDTELFMHPPEDAALPSASELRDLYGLTNTPRIAWIPRDANRWVARLRLTAESFRAGRHRAYAYTTRGLPALGALLGGARHVFLEIHQPFAFGSRHDRVAFLLARRSKRLHVVCISQRLAGIIAKQGGVDESSIIVEHSGHSNPICRDYEVDSAAGRRLCAMYVGSFDPGKGVDTVLDVAGLNPTIDFIIVGGTAGSRRLPDNVSVRARVPHADVPELLSQADILLMPFTTYKGSAIEPDERGPAEEFYSPLKMVEYLAAGRSIVSSNLPSIAEVLVDESNCLLVAPDAVAEWSAALGRLEHDAKLRVRLARGAAQTAESHTNLERVRGILERSGAEK